MKIKKRIVAFSTAIAVFVAAYFFFPIRPFSRLNTDDVQQILVSIVPPEKQVELSCDEVGEAVGLLKDLIVYQPDYQANSTVGQVVRFTLVYTDGTRVEIVNAANVSLTWNGRSYRANYESAEALNAFANRIAK